MQFHATQIDMISALAFLTRIIPPAGGTMPILSGVQMIARDQQIRLSATDLTTSLDITIPGEVIEPGQVVLPAAPIRDLIHRLPTTMFTLESEDVSGRATIRYGRNYATLYGFGSEVLPAFPDFAGADDPPLEWPAGTLSRLSHQLLFACAKDDSRPALKGVALSWADAHLVFVATDGTRLSHVTLPASEDPHWPQPLVIAAKTLAEAARMNAEAPVSLHVNTSGRLIAFSAPHMLLRSRLLNGPYPAIDRVIPDDYPTQVVIPLADLRSAVARVTLITSRHAQDPTPVRLSLDAQTSGIRLTTKDPAIGQAEEWVDGTVSGQDLDILLNSEYFLEALKSLQGSDVAIGFAGIEKPAKMLTPDQSDFFHILLPLRQLV